MHAPNPVVDNLDLFGGPPRAPSADGGACTGEPGDDANGSNPANVAPAAASPESQLDLFRDSPAEVAANAARAAIRESSPDRARRFLVDLRALPAWSQFVADADACLELIERRDARWTDVPSAVQWIESALSPAAERVLPGEAMGLLRPALDALLPGASTVLDASTPLRGHRAYVWQLLGQPAQAAAAIEADARWQGRPDALAWHADLSEQAGLHALASRDVVELCLGWPEQAEQWLASSAAWVERWSAWCELDDVLPLHAFPAWARLHFTPEMPVPDATDPRPGAALLRIADELACDPEDLDLRKSLQRLNPVLLGLYLKRRGARNG